jgi:hypothetical protein
MSVDQVQVLWTGSAAQGGGVTNFHFEGAVGSAAQQRDAVVAFLTATNDQRATSSTWTIATDVKRFNVATGALESINTVTTATDTGDDGGDILGVATQGLLRLLTTSIVSGRLLRGRLFLPANTETVNSGGGPTSTYRSDYEAAAATLIAEANTNWGVWSRTHGAFVGVNSASVWNQWAVLRSRRD